ncbi:MAG: cysteine desulfurase [Ruminococcus sp.]|nr:cysteine desulfurase [Ruminococcus sp.]
MEHYLDNAATTKPCEAAKRAMIRCVEENYGNPSSLHRKGLDAQHEVDNARRIIAKALGCKPQEILFTSGATESNNLALRGTAARYGKWRKKIVVSGVEHASVKQTLRYLRTEGFDITEVMPRTDGLFYAEDFLNVVDKNTCLVSIMLVNNENGYRLPVEQVFRSVKRSFPDVITHCDGVQGFLKIPFRVRTLQADLISISGHKVHGIKGVGALYQKQGVLLNPILFGGHQENGVRPGTESVPLIASFGAAVKTLFPTLDDRFAYVSDLKKRLIALLQSMRELEIQDIPDASPYVLNISLLGYRSETVMHFLEKRDIFLSSGSACSKGASSGVLEAFGANDVQVDSALRISFSSENQEEDLLALRQGLEEAQHTLLHK